MARDEMYTDTKTDNHKRGDGSEHFNSILNCRDVRIGLGKLEPKYGAGQWRANVRNTTNIRFGNK
jgi:hypothetical protein